MSFEVDSISDGSTTVGLLPYGCTLESLVLSRPELNLHRDLVVGFQSPIHHHYSEGGRKFLNQVVGRYANRLPGGQVEFSSACGARHLTLEGDDQDVCLHGGKQGFDTVDWVQVDDIEQSQLFRTSDVANANTWRMYKHSSAAGDDGFPNMLETEVLIRISKSIDDNSRVALIMRARLVQDATSSSGKRDQEPACPVNLTWHIGYNLADFSQADDVMTHKLFIDSDKTPQLDDKMLPTGTLLDIKPDDSLDFHSQGLSGPHRTIGHPFPPGGVDHNFVFKSVDTTKPQVVLTSPDDALTVRFRTNQSSVQCYTASGFDASAPLRKTIHDPRGAGPYPKYGAVFLEFQHPVATFLHRALRDAAGTDTILTGHDIYENFVELEIVASR
ncbi:hypothetical protein OIO90_002389 [Microbotryomycetes sp. JL221]|nr:hypothetical protein OIO90_002389 [Microbotryomycetes sp. JL221]